MTARLYESTIVNDGGGSEITLVIWTDDGPVRDALFDVLRDRPVRFEAVDGGVLMRGTPREGTEGGQ